MAFSAQNSILWTSFWFIFIGKVSKPYPIHNLSIVGFYPELFVVEPTENVLGETGIDRRLS